MSRLAALVLALLSSAALAVAPAAAAAPVNEKPPVIDDTSPEVGDTLNAGGDVWDGGVESVVYQWRRCDAGGACADIADAAGAAYTVVPADARSRLQVRATATNADGSASSDSEMTDPVPDVPPQNMARPSITGTPRGGETLTAVDGTWSGTSPSVTRRWLRCDGAGGGCEPIAGATGQALLLGPADQGRTIRVRETASNGAGEASAESDATALVPVPVSSAVAPEITGVPVVGNTLVGSAGRWAGTPPFLITRRWQRCPGDEGTCTDVPGRVSDVYTLQAADVASRIRVVVRASNDGGSTSAASALVGPVTGAGIQAGALGPPPTRSTATPLAVAFDGRPRRAGLARTLRGRLKLRARCTGPCRVVMRLALARPVARKWRVPAAVATGRRTRAAAGTAVVRPRFARKTRARLRRARKLVVTVTAQGRDGAGTVVSQRTWKLTLAR